MISLDRVGNILKQNGFAGPRWGNDQRPLALTNRCNQINNARGAVLRCGICQFHIQSFIRIKRRQIFKRNFVTRPIWIFKVNFLNLRHPKIAFRILWRLNNTLDCISCTQRKLSNHFWRYIDIIRARQIICLWRPQKPKSILKYFQNPIAGYFGAIFRTLFQNREHHIALTHGRRVLNFQLFSHREQIFWAFRLQFS